MSDPDQMLKKLRRLEENMRCPNCETPAQQGIGFSHVCVKFKTFICAMCKTSHQAISHRVKSISMSTWTVEEVQALAPAKGGSNNNVRHSILAKAPPVGERYSNGVRPKEGSKIEHFKQFILDAYEYYKFKGEFNNSNNTSDSNLSGNTSSTANGNANVFDANFDNVGGDPFGQAPVSNNNGSASNESLIDDFGNFNSAPSASTTTATTSTFDAFELSAFPPPINATNNQNVDAFASSDPFAAPSSSDDPFASNSSGNAFGDFTSSSNALGGTNSTTTATNVSSAPDPFGVGSAPMIPNKAGTFSTTTTNNNNVFENTGRNGNGLMSPSPSGNAMKTDNFLSSPMNNTNHMLLQSPVMQPMHAMGGGLGGGHGLGMGIGMPNAPQPSMMMNNAMSSNNNNNNAFGNSNMMMMGSNSPGMGPPQNQNNFMSFSGANLGAPVNDPFTPSKPANVGPSLSSMMSNQSQIERQKQMAQGIKTEKDLGVFSGLKVESSMMRNTGGSNQMINQMDNLTNLSSSLSETRRMSGGGKGNASSSHRANQYYGGKDSFSFVSDFMSKK